MHTRLNTCLALLAAGLLISAPLQAKPPEWAPAHGHHKDKHDKHKDKHDKHDKHKDKHKDKHEKYDNKHQHENNSSSVGIVAPVAAATVLIPAIIYTPLNAVPADIAAGQCDRDNAVKETVGTVVGGVLGAVLGSQIGDGTGKQLATIGGAVLGAYIGNQIAAQMDEADYHCTNRALEYAADQRPVTWQNSGSGLVYSLQPVKSMYNEAKQVCREFVTIVNNGAQSNTIKGQACRDAEGVWRTL